MPGNIEIILLLLIASYFIGNLSLSYIWVKAVHKQDLRQMGSGSLGARNAGRILGKKAFVAVFLFDFLKGATPVLGLAQVSDHDLLVNLAAVLVIAGHVWPAVFGFKGGKGISCAIGALVVVDPVIVGILSILFVIIYVAVHNVIVSGLIGFVLLPVILLLVGFEPAVYIPVTLCSVIILWAHRSNIVKEFALLKGVKQ